MGAATSARGGRGFVRAGHSSALDAKHTGVTSRGKTPSSRRPSCLAEALYVTFSPVRDYAAQLMTEHSTCGARRMDRHPCRAKHTQYDFSGNCLTRQGRINVTLTPAAQKFVLHWGEMGQAWGINRTMAQVHALLFVAPTPLDAEEISTLLDVSRSNVSTSLRELITWGVVRRVHVIGDRRDRFEALKDVMETFRVIMAERKRREMDPTIALLEHCVNEAKLGDPAEQYTREQLEKMLEFTRMVTTWYGYIDNLSTSALLRLFRGGAMLAKVFGRSKHARATIVGDPEQAGAGTDPKAYESRWRPAFRPVVLVGRYRVARDADFFV